MRKVTVFGILHSFGIFDCLYIFSAFFQITPIKSSELDAVLAENKKQISKMTIVDDDLDGETKDLFVTIDNPEKHTTTMESYITFRISTKVFGVFYQLIILTSERKWRNADAIFLFSFLCSCPH